VTLERGGGLEEEWRNSTQLDENHFLLRIQNCGGSKVRREKKSKRELAEIDCRELFFVYAVRDSRRETDLRMESSQIQGGRNREATQATKDRTERERKERIMGREGKNRAGIREADDEK